MPGGRDDPAGKSRCEHGMDGCAVRKDGRLGVVRRDEILIGSLPHHPSDRVIEGGVDGRQHVGRDREPLGHILRHADLLGALPREQENRRYHRTTTLPQVKPAPNDTSITIEPGVRRPSSWA